MPDKPTIQNKRISSLNEGNAPLVSIITIVLNNVKYIRDAIQSVLAQDYPNIEYLVIDGGSKDGTVEIIKEYKSHISKLFSEPDEGLYDALNKGIRNASGQIIGILHSDDVFTDQSVISDMVSELINKEAELVFSDLVIVNGRTGMIFRYYMAHYFMPFLLRTGWVPPHPTCFMKKELFDEFGLYSTDYVIAGDFDFLIRMFFSRSINWNYYSRVTVKMRTGGISSSGINSKILAAFEIRRSLKENKVWSLSIFQLFRYVIRLIELLVKPKNKSQYEYFN